MSDLQTQLREVLRENELLQREVSEHSNLIWFPGVPTSNVCCVAFKHVSNHMITLNI